MSRRALCSTYHASGYWFLKYIVITCTLPWLLLFRNSFTFLCLFFRHDMVADFPQISSLNEYTTTPITCFWTIPTFFVNLSGVVPRFSNHLYFRRSRSSSRSRRRNSYYESKYDERRRYSRSSSKYRGRSRSYSRCGVDERAWRVILFWRLGFSYVMSSFRGTSSRSSVSTGSSRNSVPDSCSSTSVRRRSDSKSLDRRNSKQSTTVSPKAQRKETGNQVYNVTPSAIKTNEHRLQFLTFWNISPAVRCWQTVVCLSSSETALWSLSSSFEALISNLYSSQPFRPSRKAANGAVAILTTL